MSELSMTDLYLADTLVGRTCWRALLERRFTYDGQTWSVLLPPQVSPALVPVPVLASESAVAWLRHWLTQGIIELEPAARRYPDVIDRMGRTLVPAGTFARYSSFGGVVLAVLNPKGVA